MCTPSDTAMFLFYYYYSTTGYRFRPYKLSSDQYLQKKLKMLEHALAFCIFMTPVVNT